jgi:hypothetical protein
MKVPSEYIHFYEKVPKIAKKIFFWSSDLLRKGHSLRGQALYKGPKFCFHTMGFMGIKRRRVERRFQKYKLVLKTKCTTQGAFCVVNKIFNLDLLHLGAFCL